jgi:hypothetical protein
MKYGNDLGRWVLRVLREPYGVSLWKHIHNAWGRFSSVLKFGVDSGNQVRFWQDLWCAKVILMKDFPGLFFFFFFFVSKNFIE